jgi:hypothetical protein
MIGGMGRIVTSGEVLRELHKLTPALESNGREVRKRSAKCTIGTANEGGRTETSNIQRRRSKEKRADRKRGEGKVNEKAVYQNRAWRGLERRVKRLLVANQHRTKTPFGAGKIRQN